MTRTAAIVVALLALSARVTDADDRADAERLYVDGQAAFDASRFDEALAAWRQSYELSREPALLFNIAQAYRLRAKPGDCAKAAETYRRFITQDPMSSQRALAESLAVDTERCAAAERAAAAPLTEAPRPAPLLPSSPQSPPTTTQAEAVERSGPRSLDRDDAPGEGRSKRLAGLGLAASGGLLVGAGLYAGHRASSLADEVASACATSCDWSVYGPKDADGRSAATRQYVFGGAGVAAILGGGVLYWLGAREGSRSSLSIGTRDGGAALSWTGSW